MTIENVQNIRAPFDYEKTYYLSGPMTGYPGFNYEAFEQALHTLTESGIKVESPHTNEWPEGHESLSPNDLWVRMMDKCMEQMKDCHGIILMQGWVNSRGAWREVMYAKERAWPFYFLAITNEGQFELSKMSAPWKN